MLKELGQHNSEMKLNLGVMVDGNARSAFLDSMNALGVSPEELNECKDEVIEHYKNMLPEMYVKNARWLVRLGEELHSMAEGSEYVIYIYNMTNRARSHFKGIEHAILEVSPELIDRLNRFGDVCLVGNEKEKDRWIRTFPKYKKLNKSIEGSRTVLLMGYQQGSGEDPSTRYMEPLDIFIRSTQMRLSGMYLPCMENTQFAILSHIPHKYNPKNLINKLMEIKIRDEEHDDANIYTDSVYETWSKHQQTPPSIYVTSNAHPPEKHFL